MPQDNNIRDAIMAAIASVDDKTHKTILLLMYRLHETVNEVHINVLDRMDSLLANEKAIKSIVLNGLAETHHEDHAWISQMRDKEEERATLCRWTAEKVKEEEENRVQLKNIRWAWVDKALWAATVFLVGGGAGFIVSMIVRQGQ